MYLDTQGLGYKKTKKTNKTLQKHVTGLVHMLVARVGIYIKAINALSV